MSSTEKIEIYYSQPVRPEVMFERGYMSVIFIEQGQLQMKTGAGIKEVNKGNILINTPVNEERPFLISQDCLVVGVKFTFDFLNEVKILDHIQDKVAHFEYHYQPVWQLSVENQDLLRNLLRNMEKRMMMSDDHRFGKELFILSFTELVLELAEIGKNIDKDTLLNYKRNEQLVQQFVILSRRFFKTEVKLDFYASKLFVSTKYLSEVVKEMTKQTAKEILLDLRISFAKQQLRQTHLDIAEIAYQLSYDSPASFSKYFKQVTGISPKEFRDTV